MNAPVKSRRGVYYDLRVSPYEVSVTGETFKFSSKKKLEIFTREYTKRVSQLSSMYERIEKITGVKFWLTTPTIKRIADRLYKQVER